MESNLSGGLGLYAPPSPGLQGASDGTCRAAVRILPVPDLSAGGGRGLGAVRGRFNSGPRPDLHANRGGPFPGSHTSGR